MKNNHNYKYNKINYKHVNLIQSNNFVMINN